MINREALLAIKLYRQAATCGNTEAGRSEPTLREQMATTDAAKLCSLARSIRRLDTIFRDRKLTNRELDRNFNLNEAVRIIAGKYGLKVTRNHEAQGLAVYLQFPNMPGSGWGI